MNTALLSITSLSVVYSSQRSWLKAEGFVALDQVSLAVKPGEILGIVGESGCGKSTLARAILGLLSAQSGSILFKDQQLVGATTKQMRAARPYLQMVFQDPLSALDPRMPIARQIAEPLKQFNPQLSKREVEQKVVYMLERVGLSAQQMQRYPHQFSGGQCQRINIARALINQPELLVCDEAVSALDVSIQAQIIELLIDLRNEFGMAIIFISHDLRVIRQLCERVLVLRNGRVIESASADDLFAHPAERYTRELLAAVPSACSDY